jgi:motility quorum-sensing regulator / GCU-specific mRNA interferase toxin
MEKKKPHYPLDLVKSLVADESRDPFTQSAKNSAAEMGFAANELRGVVAGLTAQDFYKSMTTHADSAMWHGCLSPCNPVRRSLRQGDGLSGGKLIVVPFKRL